MPSNSCDDISHRRRGAFNCALLKISNTFHPQTCPFSMASRIYAWAASAIWFKTVYTCVYYTLFWLWDWGMVIKNDHIFCSFSFLEEIMWNHVVTIWFCRLTCKRRVASSTWVCIPNSYKQDPLATPSLLQNATSNDTTLVTAVCARLHLLQQLTFRSRFFAAALMRLVYVMRSGSCRSNPSMNVALKVVLSDGLPSMALLGTAPNKKANTGQSDFCSVFHFMSLPTGLLSSFPCSLQPPLGCCKVANTGHCCNHSVEGIDVQFSTKFLRLQEPLPQLEGLNKSRTHVAGSEDGTSSISHQSFFCLDLICCSNLLCLLCWSFMGWDSAPTRQLPSCSAIATFPDLAAQLITGA